MPAHGGDHSCLTASSLGFTSSKPTEAAIELPVIPAVHFAVPVEVEVPEVTGRTGLRLERGPKQLAVLLVHDSVAIAVAEQPEEAVHPVASRHAITRPLQFPPPPVVHHAPKYGRGLVAGR